MKAAIVTFLYCLGSLCFFFGTLINYYGPDR